MSFMTTTNGDRVRLMSDEKIADLVANGCPPGKDVFYCEEADRFSHETCAACWLRWLQKEATA